MTLVPLKLSARTGTSAEARLRLFRVRAPHTFPLYLSEEEEKGAKDLKSPDADPVNSHGPE